VIVTGSSLSPGDVVTAELKVTGTAPPSGFSRKYTTIADSEGNWELSLEPNDIERGAPVGAYYKIVEDVGGSDTTTNVIVPRGYGRVALSALPELETIDVADIDTTYGADEAAILTTIVEVLAAHGLLVATDSS